jgi:hypothetical protein
MSRNTNVIMAKSLRDLKASMQIITMMMQTHTEISRSVCMIHNRLAVCGAFEINWINNNFILNPCGGGVEYLHRDPASRKRRRNGTKKRPRHSLSG